MGAGGKSEINGLKLALRDGSESHIPIRGGRGRFRDAYEFLRFLDRVLADLRGDQG